MSTLSPKEFRLFIKTMTEEYKDPDQVELDQVEQDQGDNYFKDLYDDLKRENQLLKKSIAKLTKENMQLHIKCKQRELDEQKLKEETKEETKEQIKLDSTYFRKRLNL